jgi:predicted O-methyltransferase YrrM
MSLDDYLNVKETHCDEGYCQEVPEQVEDLIRLTKNIKNNIMEIGFNGGHSSELFLKNNSNINLTSFDLGSHDYVKIGKEYIDKTFPNRHSLILGDSRITVPKFIINNRDIKFDVIFIDGGHDYEIAISDLENCFHLAHKDTIVILDDTMFKSYWLTGWNIGPTRAWTEYLEKNKILELGRVHYGFGRGMCWGKYIM